LALFGSRARGDAHAGSDWDFAALTESAEQLEAARVALSILLQTDQLDVVDLNRAGGLLRHRVASEGRLVYEDSPGEFIAFQLAATQFWCDIEPVLRRVHTEILRGLKAQ
jgi:predicted nucleotidyltransferase